MKVSYISNPFDSSGYADAARNNIAALLEVGIEVDITAMSFENFRSDTGIIGKQIAPLIKNSSDARLQIIHATPPVFHKFRRSDKYNIAYTTWEATKLPSGWKDACNAMDEIWVPCNQNKEVFIGEGVTKPIYIMPHTFNTSVFDAETTEVELQNIMSNDYKFYSIFQWTERKNPVSMLKAYLTEFSSEENVCLILKTYLFNPTDSTEMNKIRDIVKDIKDKLYLKSYPKIVLINELLSRAQINTIHKQMDCYLSFHRNEGFGIPIVEAMMASKPIIATNYGGPLDFLSHNENSMLCDYQLTPCYGMPWETYNGKMSWADIDIMDARSNMRRAFQNQEAAKKLGSTARSYVRDNLSWQKIGNLMKERLEAV